MKKGKRAPASRVRAAARGSKQASSSSPVDPLLALQNQKHHLARIRHELRTPINHIIGYSEMLQEEALDAGQKQFLRDLERIHHGGRQLLDLINRFFDSEKFDSRRWDLHHVLHELRTPVNHIIGYTELLQEQAEEIGAKSFVPDLQKIHLAATNWLALMEGHLVHSFVEKVAQHSALAGARKVEKPPDLSMVIPFPPRHARVETVGSGRLLVVDDDQGNREMLSRRLRKQGYAVQMAGSGQEALRLIRSEPFDLVLLDMIMPEIDGFKVLCELKSHDVLRHVPVVMISALDDLEGIVRCIELGAEDYISKPFNPVFLHARIGAALEKKRLRDQEQVYLKRIQEEQEKSERLLLNVLPKPIAERLKQGESGIVDNFSEVTVLFADLVGFTALSIHISATEMVQLLDEVFSAFDLLAARHGLEKIKTIGDAYMAVSGMPTPRTDHAQGAADLALDMMKEVEEFNRGYRTSLRMRIGLNSGPVTAGIIGRNKFIYDLWGDTVNVASRMESHGHPGQIQVTEMTYHLLEKQFHFQKRGSIDVKGKGEMTVYWLAGRRI
ncbi:MAG: adenylate/guanylate cyclase domain-containing protein [Verrucomicrobiota bacterium]